MSSSPIWALLVGALLSFPALSQDWQNPQWLKLLHAHKGLLGGYVSEADGEKFFLHADGKTSPQLELEAFKEALTKNEPNEELNAYCRFPARFRWLKKHDPSVTIPVVKCPKYEAFRNRVAAKSVSVVFSSYYLGNPSSSFGHTFIRLGKSPHEAAAQNTSIELLDTGINYGAVTGNSGPLLYVVGGLTGIFPGTFNAIPYYYKVREYNDFETRDLWSYQLDFDQDEIDMMVDHIWELGHTHFDYFFLTENCSYHVMTILEAAREDLQLSTHLPRLYVIPSDTLKVIEDSKLIKRVTFRPAPSTQFYHQLKLLTPQEQSLVVPIMEHEPVALPASPERQALIYDTVLSLIDYKYAEKILKQDEKAQAIKRPILIARSKIPVRSGELDFADKMTSAPHLGHGSNRLMMAGNNREGKNTLDLEWRFAFHDFLDYDVAYPTRTKVDVMKFYARTDGHEVQLRDVSFIDLSSLGKWDVFNKASTWKVRLGQWQTRRDTTDLSTQGLLGGYGYSYHFKFLAPYIMAHAEAGYISEKLKKAKLAYGSDVGLLFDVTHKFKFKTELDLRVHPWDDSLWMNEMRYSNKDFGIGIFHQKYLSDGVDDLGVRFFSYF